MSIDKSVYTAPQGLDSDGISVEIVDPEEVHIEGPGFEMHMEKGTPAFDANLAEELNESTLLSLSHELIGDVEEDMRSRKEWLDTYIKGLKLLGLKYEERTEPWPGASGVFHPLLMEAAVRFQSDLVMETFPPTGPVRTMIVGRETPDKKQAATRVQEDMNYMLTEGMPEYRTEHERLLLSVAISGNAFKKIYFDPAYQKPEAPFIPAEDIIVPFGAANLETAERVTHRMRKTENELRKLQIAGFYRDVDLGKPMQIMDEVEKEKARDQGLSASIDHRFQLLEIHCHLDLPGYEDPDGIKLPYVVTIEKGTSTVLSIRRNWLEDDKLKLRRQHFVHYGYIPGFGFYCFGLIHLIGGHTQTATSLIRQLIDAGTLSNLPGGLKAKGMRVKGDDTPIAPGEFRDVDLPSGSIRDNILPLPYKEPSQVLMALLDKVVMDGKQFAATAELNVSDMSAQAPVGTTLAILERAMKVMSAVQARIHYAMRQEFKLLAAIIRDNTPEDYDYDPEVGDRSAKRADYDCCNVLPVSDPNASTMAQRVVQYQAVIQLAQQAPQIYDLPFLHRQMIEVLGLKDASKIIPLNDDIKPVDPISENMAIMNGRPVKAFMYQDHQSHLAVHTSLIQDPKMAGMIGQNPQAQAVMAAASAHIMEHLAYDYRQQIEDTLGATLPPPPKSVQGGQSRPMDDDPGYLDPALEVKISQLAALAASQLLQKNKNEAQQAQIQQQQQDPLIQMQQQELQLKQQQMQLDAQLKQAELQMKQQQFQMEMQVQKAEIDRKTKADQLNAAVKASDQKLKQHDTLTRHRIEGAKLGIETARQHADRKVEGAKMGVEVAKHKVEQHGKLHERGMDALKHLATLEHEGKQSELDREHQAEQAQQASADQAQQENEE